ncbi:MAG: PEP-CTERM sorting domain-containing protein [Sedimentisphaerales bacterium]|nr:PEP-CTERM sorting domain-containing protein [Sedimentisphaerales bacterium]
MKDKTKKVLVVFLCIFSLAVVSSVSQAATTETINLTTGDINYYAGQFVGPYYEIEDGISFPKFNPNLGTIKKVELTATIVSAAYSTIEVENEREDNPQYPILHAGGWLTGVWLNNWYPMPLFNVTGGSTVGVLDVDDEPGSPPDWWGSDYDSFSAAVYAPIFDKMTILPDPMYPPEEPPNYNPAFAPFVHFPDTPANWEGAYEVMSCMTGTDPAGLLEARFTPGNVSMRLDVRYTYEPIPEPATIMLLGLGVLVLRKRRA